MSVSCQNDPAPAASKAKEYHAQFFIRYLADNQEIKAEATFKVGDSIKTAKPIGLKDPIYFNKNLMDERDLKKNGIRYKSVTKGAFPKTSNFNFNFELEPFSYEIAFSKIVSPALSADHFALSEENEITWNGDPLVKGESMVIVITDENDKTIFNTVSGPTDVSSVKLYRQQVGSLQSGKGQLYLVKKQAVKKKVKSFNVVSIVEYYTNPIDILIKK